MTRLPSTVLIGVMLMASLACGVPTSDAPPAPGSAAALLRHVQQFGANDVRDENPGGPGQQRAIAYAADYLESLRLNTIVQSVPLTSITPISAKVTVTGPKGATIVADEGAGNFILTSGRAAEQVSIDTTPVFAGYGIVSPEYGRNDYKTADVTGKIVILLQGSPTEDGRDELGELGESYYGTRLYKFAEAARRGAAAVLIVNNDDSVPWETIRVESGRSALEIATKKNDPAIHQADIQGWLSLIAARRLFAIGGMDFDQMMKAAKELAFVPVEMPGVRTTAAVTSRIEQFTSSDAIAILPGQTPQYVIVAGRWNRLDSTPFIALKMKANALAEAAADDGSGAAVVLETARKMASGPKPLRSVVFLISTALRPGNVGLQYFAEHPPASLPIDTLTAMIFMDRADLTGNSQRVGKIGTESDPTLAQITRQAAIDQGRLVELDEIAYKRYYYQLGNTDLTRDGVRTIYLTTHRAGDLAGALLRNVAKHDEVIGAAAPPAHPATMPLHDVDLLASIARMVANATNWPPRVDPAVLVQRSPVSP